MNHVLTEMIISELCTCPPFVLKRSQSGPISESPPSPSQGTQRVGAARTVEAPRGGVTRARVPAAHALLQPYRRSGRPHTARRVEGHKPGVTPRSSGAVSFRSSSWPPAVHASVQNGKDDGCGLGIAWVDT